MDIMKEFKTDLVVKEGDDRKRFAEVTLDNGRDKGKRFLISEMPVTVSTRFLMKAGNALAETGLMPDYIARAVNIEWQTLFGVTFASLSAVKAETFFDLVNDLYKQSIKIWGGTMWREVIPDVDLFEMSSFASLADKVVELHAGFSLAAAVSGFWKVTQVEAMELMQQEPAAQQEQEQKQTDSALPKQETSTQA